MYYYFVFANKSNIQEECCLKIFIGRVLTEVIKETSCSKKYLLSRVNNLISAPNFYCCHFNDRAVPWAFSVGVQFMQIRLGSKVLSA